MNYLAQTNRVNAADANVECGLVAANGILLLAVGRELATYRASTAWNPPGGPVKCSSLAELSTARATHSAACHTARHGVDITETLTWYLPYQYSPTMQFHNSAYRKASQLHELRAL
jgi:hypothetical protein